MTGHYYTLPQTANAPPQKKIGVHQQHSFSAKKTKNTKLALHPDLTLHVAAVCDEQTSDSYANQNGTAGLRRDV